MSHNHHHHHHAASGKNLFLTILLNLGISLAELVGGIISGSMSLISDAIHNFSDVISLIISYIANKKAQEKATERQTFGYKRSEIIAAFINSTTLIVLAFFILYEAVLRFIHPVEIKGNLVIYLALLSIAVNALSVLFIKEDAEHNMNIKSAYLHLFGDMMTSVAVFIGGLLMKYFHIYWIDPVLSILIALYLLKISWEIFRSSLRIMMQFTPEHINISEIAQNISQIKGIKNIHHIHIWQINEHDIMFEAHIDLKDDEKISDFEKIMQQVKVYLSGFDIHHITLQPEFSVADDKNVIVNN